MSVAKARGEAGNQPELLQRKSMIMYTLLIDNNKSTLFATRELLISYGHRVDSATSASEALAKAKLKNYDLVVLDMDMPDESSMQLLNKLGRSIPLLPVFGLIEEMSITKIMRAIKLSAIDVFKKPLTLKDIIFMQHQVTESILV